MAAGPRPRAGQSPSASGMKTAKLSTHLDVHHNRVCRSSTQRRRRHPLQLHHRCRRRLGPSTQMLSSSSQFPRRLARPLIDVSWPDIAPSVLFCDVEFILNLDNGVDIRSFQPIGTPPAAAKTAAPCTQFEPRVDGRDSGIRSHGRGGGLAGGSPLQILGSAWC
ncbi:hypothetical protein C8R44DRAFT_888137 [Mycena epipterygia]|nr:hypothetical protein C8R44DRAFT_888137 [Mycena epipterygia]